MLHIKSLKRRVIFWSILAFVLLVGVVALFRFILYPSSCGVLPLGHDYLCYANNVDRIYTTEGVEAAFMYFDGLSENLNYGASHLIGHQLGHALWEDTRDIEKALSLVPYRDYSATEVFRHSGAVHGVFHSYFLEGADTQDVHELIAGACRTLTNGQRQLLLRDCSHGVGHGLMAYTNNDIQQTLRLCKETMQPDNCAEGAFMERGLLYIPGYGSTNVPELSPEVCAAFSEEDSKLCAQHIGWIAVLKDLVQKQKSDTTQTLKVCEAYTGTLQYECYFLVARDLFTIVYDNNKEDMNAACEALPVPQACFQGLAEWEQWDKAYRDLDASSEKKNEYN